MTKNPADVRLRKINDEERELCAANGIEFLQLPVAIDTPPW